MVSIIIPNYNHAHFLNRRIESILSQTYQNFELILLDDASQDNSKEILSNFFEHPKVSHVLFNEQNSGSTFKQWFKGIQLAKGEFIWIAESDDYCEPLFLERMIALSYQRPKIGIAYCKSLPVNSQNETFDLSDDWLKRVDETRWDDDYYNTGTDECENYLSIRCTIPNASAVLFKREVFEKINLVNIPYKICGDWFTYVNILKSYNIAYTSCALNYHRSHANNARTQHRNRILLEQFSVVAYINRHYNVKKKALYYKSIEEKIDFWFASIKTRKLTIAENYAILKLIPHSDRFFIYRIAKVFLFKLLNKKVGL